MFAVYGGSGFENFEEFETVEQLPTETPFGSASSGIKKVRVGSHELIFVSRHGEHHELLPSEINYRANMYALKSFGATRLVAFSAVGSLQEELAPGDMVVPNQFIDRTKSIRKHTFCGDGVVGHVSLAKPIWQEAAEVVAGLAGNMNFNIHLDRTALCIEGPCFSTKAESDSYRTLGCDIIGMTSFPEYALAREAGIAYLPCSFVTDYDCWNDKIEHVTLDQVIKVMRENNAKAFQLLKALLDKDPQTSETIRDSGLRSGLLTPKERIPAAQKKVFEVLLG